MLHPWQYQRARGEATFHVQVKLLAVESGIRTPGDAGVDAEVVHIFRGDSTLQPGDKIHFSVSVLQDDEPRTHIPIGGTIWTNYPALLSAKFMEVFLVGTPPDCSISLWQQAIIDTPTNRPTLSGSLPLLEIPRSWFYLEDTLPPKAPEETTVKRDWLLEQLLGMTLLTTSLPTLIALRAFVQSNYQWGWFGVTGEGMSLGFFALILPLLTLGWAAFYIGARHPGQAAGALISIWFGAWLAAALYGTFTLGERMTLRGDAWGVVVPLHLVGPLIFGALFVVSVLWLRQELRRPRYLTVKASRLVETVLIIAGAALMLLAAVMFALGDGVAHTVFDRAAVLVFVAGVIGLGAGINPWRNRFGDVLR